MTRSRRDSVKQHKARGFVAPTHLYTVDELRARLGFGAWAWRSLRRNGLRVHRIGGRAFVMGSDLIEHFKSHGLPSHE